MNETNNEQKTKKDNGKTIVIIILVILLIGALGYIVYDKIIASENEENTQIEQKLETPKEDLDEIGTTLLDKINNYKLDLLDIYGNNITVNSVPTNEQLDTMYYYLLEKNNNDAESLNMTKSVVDNYFNDVYGITPTEYPDIMCKIDNISAYTYDVSKKAYDKVNNHGHGGYENYSLSQIITNIKKDNDNYVLDVAKLYVGPMMTGYEGYYYSDATYTNNLEEFNQFFDDEKSEYDRASAIKYFQNNKEQYKNVKPQYRYTFKKDNENYYIVKYEIIK